MQTPKGICTGIGCIYMTINTSNIYLYIYIHTEREILVRSELNQSKNKTIMKFPILTFTAIKKKLNSMPFSSTMFNGINADKKYLHRLKTYSMSIYHSNQMVSSHKKIYKHQNSSAVIKLVNAKISFLNIGLVGKQIVMASRRHLPVTEVSFPFLKTMSV